MTETRFDLSITLGNDAMQTPADIADALRHLADQLEDISPNAWYDTDGRIRDLNGNTVGTWKIDAYSHDG